MSSFCVVENLSLWNFLFRVAPFLVQKRIQKLLVVDATPFVFWAAPVLGRMAGVSVSRFRFRSIDIKDEEGLLLRLRIPNKDLHDVFKIVSQDPSFQKICDFKEKDGRWATFLSKSIGSFDPHETQTFFRAMMILQAARWQARKESGAKAFVFLNQRPWGETLAAYGKQQEVGVLFLPSAGLGDKNRLAYGYLRSFFQHFLYWRWILKFRRKTSIQNRKKTGFKL
ncbi:MAG: hypothetical protein U1D33_02380, partial [bacterium]|nr:hypothetical protein [bacterium]